MTQRAELEIRESHQSDAVLSSRGGARLIGASALVAAASVVAARAYCGSTDALLAWCRGDAITINDHRTRDLGVVRAESAIPVVFSVRNLLNKSVEIVGADVSCGCLYIDERFPMTIPARSDMSFRCTLRPRAKRAGTAFRETVELYPSAPNSPLVLVVSGAVEPIRTGERKTQ